MEYNPSHSSGTDDDPLPPSHHSRNARAGHVAHNVRPIPGGVHVYHRVQNDVESQIRQLEQEAYGSVLRAFKAQSDAITWEKEGLITELRKELRVSDDEHRDLLSRVNADEIIRGIREWRQSGGFQSNLLNNAQPNHDNIPSPTVSASRKRQTASQSIFPLPLGAPSRAMHSQPVFTMQASLASKRGAPGSSAKKTKLGHQLPVSYTPMSPTERGQVVNRGSGAMVTTQPLASHYDSLIGRKVMTRWPDDNNFYEALITDYDPTKGLHLLLYDASTPNETWEWVNLEEISVEDIRWEGENPYIHRSGRGGPGRGAKKMRGGAALIGGRGRGVLRYPSIKDYSPLLNGATRRTNANEIEILNTEILIKEVETILDVTQPDPFEMEKAKKILKDHEESLLNAIARLVDASGGESDDDHHPSNGQPAERDRWQNNWFAENQHAAAYDNEVAGVGREVYQAERAIGNGGDGGG